MISVPTPQFNAIVDIIYYYSWQSIKRANESIYPVTETMGIGDEKKKKRTPHTWMVSRNVLIHVLNRYICIFLRRTTLRSNLMCSQCTRCASSTVNQHLDTVLESASSECALSRNSFIPLFFVP